MERNEQARNMKYKAWVWKDRRKRQVTSIALGLQESMPFIEVETVSTGQSWPGGGTPLQTIDLRSQVSSERSLGFRGEIGLDI